MRNQGPDFRLKLEIAPTDDEEIALLRMEHKMNCASIKNFLLSKYSTKSKEKKNFKKEHEFTLFNRYGFMTILFLMLHKMAIRHHKGIHVTCPRLPW